MSTAFEISVGLHRTGAASEAVRRSEASRIVVIPSDEDRSVLVQQPSPLKGVAHRGRIIETQVDDQFAAVPFGFESIEVTHIGTHIEFKTGNSSHLMPLSSEEDRIGVISWQVDNIEAREVIITVVGPGTNVFITGMTKVIDNTQEGVLVSTFKEPTTKPRTETLARDGKPHVFGMTYADARRSLVDYRQDVLSSQETLAQSLASVQEQTHIQHPNRFERDNAGRPEFAAGDRDVTGAAPWHTSQFAYRLVHILPNAINIDPDSEGAPYIRDIAGLERDFENLQDAHGIKLGPQEVSTAERLYRRFLYNDENLIPDQQTNLIRSVVEQQWLNLNADADALEAYNTTVNDLKLRADSRKLSYSDTIRDLAIHRAISAGSRDVDTFQQEIVTTLNRGKIKGVKARMEFTVAIGEVVGFRRGIAKRFQNLVNGKVGTPNNSDLVGELNDIAQNFKPIGLFDPSTGYGLSDHNQDMLPEGLIQTSANTLKLIGYTKKISDTVHPVYNTRKSVINFTWEADLEDVVFETIGTSEADFFGAVAALEEYVDNLSKMIQINTNWYMMHVVASGWDNIAIPLEPARVDRAINVDAALVISDRAEQVVEPGRIVDGVGFRTARFVSNGDRITYGVPDISLMLNDDLTPKDGYKAFKVENHTRPFVVVEEDNDITRRRTDNRVLPRFPAEAVLRKATTDGETSIIKTHVGYNIAEADYMDFVEDPQDRTQVRLSPSKIFPAGVGFGAMVDITETLFSSVLAQMNTLLEVPQTVFTGTVKEDNGDNLVVVADGTERFVNVFNLDVGNINVEDRVLVFQTESKKFGALKFPLTVPVANVTTREFLADRFAPKTAPAAFGQLSSGDVNTNLLQAMLAVMNKVNCLCIEPDIYYPEYENSVLSTSETNNSGSNNVTVGTFSSGGRNVYRFTSPAASDQDISIVIEHPIPFGFEGFGAIDPIRLGYVTTGTPTLELQVLDSTGTADINVTIPNSASFTTFTTGGSGGASPLTGTYTPGSSMRIVITATVMTAEVIDIGRLEVRRS